MTETLFAFVANAAWQAAVIGAIGLLLARALRPARLRFQFLAVTLAVAACAPLLTLLPRQARPATTTVIAATPIQPIRAQIAVGVYLAAVAWAALRLARAAARARRIARSSLAAVGGARVSPLIGAPVTIGRTIIVPPSIAGDARLLAAALAHERAHVRRNDYALHVALECLALPVYFHPMVILLRRAIAEAREIACDEEAAAQCGAGEYAQALVRIASLAASGTTTMIGMAATRIERRVIALLRRDRRRARRPMALVLALPFVAAAACSRVDVAPAVAEAALCGRWALVREASDVHRFVPRGYDAFIQTIEQGPNRIAVKQYRVVGNRASNIAWSVITDGVTRPLDGDPRVRGTAAWKNGRLMLEMAGPGAHRESAAVFIRDGRLVVDGVVPDRGRYHSEFRRIDP